MSTEVMEEELLRSIEEVDAKIHRFRRRVRDVLASVQAETERNAAEEKRPTA